jgi:hypothetical protein
MVIPGPGAYPAKTVVGQEGKKYSLAGRPQSGEKKRNISPGPAAYQPKVDLTERTSQNYGFGKVERSKEEKQKVVPGPGQYDSNGSIKFRRSSPSWA